MAEDLFPSEDKRTTAAEIKEAWTMEMVLEALDIEFVPDGRGEGKIFSIYNEEHTPSLHIYEDHFYDFSSGKGGDVIKFVMEFLGVPFGAAIQFLDKGVEDPMAWDKPKVKRKKKPPPTDHTDRMGLESRLWTHVDRAQLTHLTLERWGLRPGDLEEWGVRVGSGSSLWIPHRSVDEQGIPHVYGIKIRDLYMARAGASKSSWSVKPSSFTEDLYRHPAAWSRFPSFSSAPWLLVEGEPDSWAAHAMTGIDVEIVGLPTGAGTIRPEWFDRFNPDDRPRRRGFMCLDADDAGRKAAGKMRVIIPDICDVPLPPIPEFDKVDVAVAHREGWKLGYERNPLPRMVWQR